MTMPQPSALQRLTTAFGNRALVEHLEAALRTAVGYHRELAAKLRTCLDAGHFEQPGSLITRDGARMLVEDHDRCAILYTSLADLVRAALDDEDPR